MFPVYDNYLGEIECSLGARNVPKVQRSVSWVQDCFPVCQIMFTRCQVVFHGCQEVFNSFKTSFTVCFGENKLSSMKGSHSWVHGMGSWFSGNISLALGINSRVIGIVSLITGNNSWELRESPWCQGVFLVAKALMLRTVSWLIGIFCIVLGSVSIRQHVGLCLKCIFFILQVSPLTEWNEKKGRVTEGLTD